MNAVKTRQPFLCRQPKVTISGLDDAANIVLWQSVLACPGIVDVLRNLFVGIQGKCGPTEKQTDGNH
jgi:hypothetical protein